MVARCDLATHVLIASVSPRRLVLLRQEASGLALGAEGQQQFSLATVTKRPLGPPLFFFAAFQNPHSTFQPPSPIPLPRGGEGIAYRKISIAVLPVNQMNNQLILHRGLQGLQGSQKEHAPELPLLLTGQGRVP